MRAPCTFDGFSIDLFWPRPTFRTAQDDHRPRRQSRIPASTSPVLNRPNFLYDCVQSASHQLMHLLRLVPLDEIGLPAIAGEKIGKFLIVHAGEHGWIRDFPAVEMENRQNGTVARGIQKFIDMPARSQRSSLR